MKLVHVYHQHRYHTEYLGTRSLLDLDCDIIIVIRNESFMNNVGRWKIKLKNNVQRTQPKSGYYLFITIGRWIEKKISRSFKERYSSIHKDLVNSFSCKANQTDSDVTRWFLSY